MKDIPVPVEALNDVLPGSPWQPEHAARYNALNALLRQEELPRSAGPVSGGNGEILLPVRNITDEVLPGGGAVEISPEPQPEQGVNFRRPVLFGRTVSEETLFWGIATEDIAPGYGGLVQVGGAAVVSGVRGNPDRYVVPKPDGYYHFSSTGRAEVLYRASWVYPDAVVFLGGGGGGAVFNGMFAVTENEDGTVTVSDGMAITTFNDGPRPVPGTTLSTPSRTGLLYVVLNARLASGGRWDFSFSVERSNADHGYIPGEQITWAIARLTTTGTPAYPFAQLWQGGLIDFSSRYYLG